MKSTVSTFKLFLLLSCVYLSVISCKNTPTSANEADASCQIEVRFIDGTDLSKIGHVTISASGPDMQPVAKTLPLVSGEISVVGILSFASGEDRQVLVEVYSKSGLLTGQLERNIGDFSDGEHEAVIITVNATNAIPRILFFKAEPDTVGINDTIHLSSAAVDSFGGIISKWEWDIGNKKSYVMTYSSDTSIIAPAQAGSLPVVLRITDNDGNRVKDTVTITVLQDLPVADAGSDTAVYMGDTVTLRASASQKFGSIVRWEWNINGQGFIELPDSTVTFVSPDTPGVYKCVARVTDEDSLSDLDTMLLTTGLWQAVGGSTISQGLASDVNLISANNSLYVVYKDKPLGNRAMVKMFDGSTWTSAGTEFISNGPVSSLKMKSDALGSIYLAYIDTNQNRELIVKKYEGANWNITGEEIDSVYSFDFCISNSTLYLAYLPNDEMLPILGGDCRVLSLSVNRWDSVSKLNTRFKSVQIAAGTDGLFLMGRMPAEFDEALTWIGSKVLKDSVWINDTVFGGSYSYSSMYNPVVNTGTIQALLSKLKYSSASGEVGEEVQWLITNQGQSWHAVANGIESEHGILALDNDNRLYGCFKSNNELTVMKFTGNEWRQFGQKLTNPLRTWSFCVINGVPYIAIVHKGVLSERLSVYRIR